MGAPTGTKLFTCVNFSGQCYVQELLLHGFSHPEEHLTWAVGNKSRLSLPLPPDAPTAICVLQIGPFLYGKLATGVQIAIAINGREAFVGTLTEETVIGLSVLESEMLKPSCTIDISVTEAITPREAGLSEETRALSVYLRRAWIYTCNQAWQKSIPRIQHFQIKPHDSNLWSDIETNTGLDVVQLVKSFESLGHSCDFGLAQREVGAEPLGLLRFAGASTNSIYLGIISGFVGIGRPENIRPYVPENGDEYWIEETQYGLYYHTFIPPGSASSDQLIARETHRLPLLAREYMEDIVNGEKIFVLRKPGSVPEAEALAIWAALNTYAHNTLLFLEQASVNEPVHDAGAVYEIRPHFFSGKLDGVLGNVAPTVSTWLSLCANSHLAARRVISF